jgi:DNA-binding transcriptional regulator LsrR (DeoR family)
MARTDELRLVAKVARLYYERGLKQAEIAKMLNISQPTCSRLLKRAMADRIVRITVAPPPGTCLELEEALEAQFGLKEAIVVESDDDGDQLLRGLGAATAYYLETTLRSDDVVGISSWSATLLATVDAMSQPVAASTPGWNARGGVRVVQILGGVGSPAAEVHATHLTQRLARLMNADAVFLPAPGVVGSADARAVMAADPFVAKALAHFERVSLALVGIGTVQPSRLLASSGNVFEAGELEALRARGAVGDVCLRFFDAEGAPVVTELDGRVIGMELPQLRRVARSVGVAGSRRKFAAILGALRGRWINVLITDRRTAERLVKEPPPKPAGEQASRATA